MFVIKVMLMIFIHWCESDVIDFVWKMSFEIFMDCIKSYFLVVFFIFYFLKKRSFCCGMFAFEKNGRN